MNKSNSLISFLRHYGPIPAGDNMYDELIQTEIEHYGIESVIHITPSRLKDVNINFNSMIPRNVILTGTAGDGKTFHCRQVWLKFGGNLEKWNAGGKYVSLTLPVSGKKLHIIKDLSELTPDEKNSLLAELTTSIANRDADNVYLVAANDGQLLSSWRDWSESKGNEEHKMFKIVEDMLVEEKTELDTLNLSLYNLSCSDASEHFQLLIEQIVEHPQWSQCSGCDMVQNDGTTNCPIRINRECLRNGMFLKRLAALMKLARANRMHIPIRDLLLLSVNILLGDQQSGQILLTCRTAHNRAQKNNYTLTNPYSNVFGSNLSIRQRQQYQVFNILEAFGIGRETDNKFDDFLIYGAYNDSPLYANLLSNDTYYGESIYLPYLKDYLEGERKLIDDFIQALSRQRQRLFFSLPEESNLDPWHLTVYQASGLYLDFVEGLKKGSDISSITELLVRGLNRTFCGMMIDDGTILYLASSGGDGRGRIASLLNYELPTIRQRRNPYLNFALESNGATPCLQIIDPAADGDFVDNLILQLTHFEYLVRVANGSLPASFSRQCHEDFLDFKLRLIKRLDELLAEDLSSDEISLQALTMDDQGRIHPDNIRIKVGS
ncbi:TPA: hypothetical protein L7608_004753 [Klebsiella pneumoniae subsp. pneumoniae]|uniref:hypothetical protein n=1 Tax=Klebsiella TaxID=570 RepID=UPI000DFDF93F|nr:hypothetical protein [Klebsiella pneumoniae]EDR6733858.1 hypothetical protein [Salmonella enterica subsp. enterica]HBQ5789747.1 hypothetical protein [Klebsiella pneumoniae subsp. pneumoniae]HDG7792388.1 hypothetical protein [Klebsiella aerogenes]EKX4125979.1 hypothetical protein [Klebsiella pneumoniae]MCP5764886.1 hypothetical protein [Klebsiella pneumoniae]